MLFKKPSILITFDSMKNSNTGYYYFGEGLGNALIRLNKNRFNISFYLHRRTKLPFDNKVSIVWLSKFHPFYFSNKKRFNLVHITDQECRFKPDWVSAKTIMTIHDLNRIHLENLPTKSTNDYIERLRKFITKVNKVVAISNFVANDIKKIFPEATEKLSVIYNGAHKISIVKGHYPLNKPQGEFLFTIGILSPQKGFHYLPCLLENNNLELIIAGIETSHKDKILDEAKKHGCIDRVHIIGQISDADKAWYYDNCKAFVFPSMAEGFGLPVIEAMHFGKPVFLAKRTSLPEIGGDAAYYFNSFEPAEMQQVLEGGVIDFYANNCKEKVIQQSEKFTWENAAKSYLDLYEECLSN